MIKIDLPRGDNPIDQIVESLKIIDEMELMFSKREKVELDLSKVKWMLPCSALMISSKIREIENKGMKIDFIMPNKADVKKYLLDIGFPLGTNIDGNTFVPIMHFPRNTEDKHQINKEANILLDKVKNKVPSSFGESVYYIVGEITDNIDQHSNFSFVSLMAQYFPKKEYIDIGFLDNGVTIPYLFERNNIQFTKDSDAIKKAISGEVTTKIGEEMRGYGLQSCQRLAEALNGELHIISRKGAVIINSSEEPKYHDFEANYLKGTFLYFRLMAPKQKLNIYPIIEPRNMVEVA